MDPWIRKIGFPVVTLAEEPGQIGARQSRFLITGDVKPEEDETIWWIPLGLKYAAPSKGTVHTALTEKETTIRDVDDRFYKINADQTQYGFVDHPQAALDGGLRRGVPTTNCEVNTGIDHPGTLWKVHSQKENIAPCAVSEIHPDSGPFSECGARNCVLWNEFRTDPQRNVF